MQDPDWFKFNNSDGRMMERMEGRENESPVELDWRSGYDADSDGPHDECCFCGSHAHDTSDCDEADESIEEHLHEN